MAYKTMHLSISQANHVRRKQSGNRWVSFHMACLFALVPFLVSKAKITPENMSHGGPHFLGMSILAADNP